MTFQIRCAAEGVPAETMELERDELDQTYWPVRFAIDVFINKHNLTDGERIEVAMESTRSKPPREIGLVFFARTRVLSPVNGTPKRIRYAELRVTR